MWNKLWPQEEFGFGRGNIKAWLDRCYRGLKLNNSWDTVCVFLCAGDSVWTAVSRGQVWTELFSGVSVSQQRLLCVVQRSVSLQRRVHRRAVRPTFTIHRPQVHRDVFKASRAYTCLKICHFFIHLLIVFTVVLVTCVWSFKTLFTVWMPRFSMHSCGKVAKSFPPKDKMAHNCLI